MSLTALAFVVVYFGALLLALTKRPIWGLLAYLWAYYNHPPSSWWGAQLPDLRWSLTASLVTLLAVMLSSKAESLARWPVAESGGDESPDRASVPGGRSWRANGGARALIFLTAWMWIQTFWAVNPSAHLEGCVLYTKFVILFWLVYKLLVDIQLVQAFCWAHVGGCTIWGLIAYTSNVSGRMELTLGPELADSNIVGFHLVTGLAMAGFMFIGLRGLRRWVALSSIPFVLNAIILTASRSAVLGLLGAGMLALVFGPRARRWSLYLAAVLAIPLMLRLAGNELFWERMGTLRTAEDQPMEASAASRFEIVEANWRMFRDFPLGAGHRGNAYLSPAYMSRELLTDMGGQRVRAAHNTFVAIMVDQGIPGILILLYLVLWIASRLVALKRLDRQGLPPEFGLYRGALAASFGAWLVSGQFINLQRAEVFIWMIALLAVIDSLSRQAVEARLGAARGVEPAIDGTIGSVEGYAAG